MINIDEEKILELRKKGYGYKSIAGTLQIKRDAVRNLCKKHGLDGYLGYGLLKPSAKTVVETLKECKCCGNEINKEEGRGRKAKFCSPQCRRTWWNANRDKKDRKETAWYSYTCKYCEKDFKAYGNKNRKFCSIKCSNDYRFGSKRS